MRETRVPLSDLRPGEMIIRLGSREVNARFVALHDLPPGARVNGPRGGAYRLTAHGAAERVAVETYAGRPVVPHNTMATVLRDED